MHKLFSQMVLSGWAKKIWNEIHENRGNIKKFFCSPFAFMFLCFMWKKKKKYAKKLKILQSFGELLFFVWCCLPFIRNYYFLVVFLVHFVILPTLWVGVEYENWKCWNINYKRRQSFILILQQKKENINK